jgi:dCMP deaminase
MRTNGIQEKQEIKNAGNKKRRREHYQQLAMERKAQAQAQKQKDKCESEYDNVNVVPQTTTEQHKFRDMQINLSTGAISYNDNYNIKNNDINGNENADVTADNIIPKDKVNTHAKRISKDEYYLSLAETTARRSTCRRRCYGAVIVKDDEVKSTGYNGAPSGTVNCLDTECYRETHNIAHGEHYELCRAIHAENNAIISAGRTQSIGSTLYLYGFETDSNGEYKAVNAYPCLMCQRIILNSGITKIVCRQSDGGILEENTTEMIAKITLNLNKFNHNHKHKHKH